MLLNLFFRTRRHDAASTEEIIYDGNMQEKWFAKQLDHDNERYVDEYNCISIILNCVFRFSVKAENKQTVL